MSSSDPIQSDQPPVPRIHGLIIGINKYARSDVHQDLLGAVGDAQSMLKYFTDLGVPEDRFLCLYDEHATRDAILDAFMNQLINNADIMPYDPIVIYFAGHGDHMPAPKGWKTSDGMVEMILPHDASTFDTHGGYKHGIPDLTLAFLLYKMSKEKGNNITVILDSSHSGIATRRKGAQSRTSHDPDAPPIPETLDVQLRKSLSVDFPTEVEHRLTMKQPSKLAMASSLESHILLAACPKREQAQEFTVMVDPSCDDIGSPETRGFFTTALLKQLRNCDLATTSYTSLIRRLLGAHPKYPGSQNIQCEGRNQDRLLFSLQNSIAGRRTAITQTSDKAVYRVGVGSKHGVVSGTEFGVFYGEMNPSSPPCVTLVATDVGPTVSQLRSQAPNDAPNIPANAYATIIRYNEYSSGVRVWVDEAIRQDKFWKSVLTSLDSLPVFWTTSRENHDIELLFSNGDVELRGAHLTPGKFGNSQILKQALSVRLLVNALTAVIYFYFHLKSANKEAPLREELGMALRELKEKDSDGLSGSTTYDAIGEDAFGAGTVAALHADTNKAFGLELVNNSSENLFPYVLYYDFEDYSVECLYEPPGRSTRAPLLHKNSLAIGYGPGGSAPFQVDLTNPKSDKEYGAFVLRVFSEWVDIVPFIQKSLLADVSPRSEDQGERCNHFGPDAWGDLVVWESDIIWDSLVVPVEMIKGK
ncbi:unnamed protein product [Rhizoctonia solani]|uniref:Peptidase C14 caspase domain-containing protein n=3 Tax=Rhizoctonia solani TaxID=456999 RepID=A0A8H2X300_9AGAM|nr:ICE-like protease (caspase) p20 domain protein [Rhizoctonia solani AG-3 Rhs1AP]KEP53560.1 ICE-like protease (caspase) p20 domain protein [Rhizoctonia solani 123E]CAE6415127.1 unnamed protein product [Rhizoctonia solani]CAE6518517.1 unnamed protein product [Rhizoctonia solani]